MRRLMMLLFTAMLGLLLGLLPCGHIDGVKAAGAGSPVLLLQSEIGGKLVIANAVIVKKEAENSLALTSYEAIKGAARITALVHGSRSPLPAKLLKFAPEANLALLEVPTTVVLPASLGDSEVVKLKTPARIEFAGPIMSGDVATSFEVIKRSANVDNIANRPNGSVMRLLLAQPSDDNTSGAPVFLPSTGELVAISFSADASGGNNNYRFAVPTSMVGALSDKLKVSGDSVANIRVLDGKDAPILDGGESGANGDGGGLLVPIIVVVVAVVILGGTAYTLFFKGKGKSSSAVEPFSVMPILPESMEMAFITSEGVLLPMDKDPITIGRSDTNDWCFTESSVSGRHARIRKARSGSGYEVEDLSSTNGTFVRGRQVGRSEIINPGDVVKFGRKIEVKLVSRAETLLRNSKKTAVAPE